MCRPEPNAPGRKGAPAYRPLLFAPAGVNGAALCVNLEAGAAGKPIQQPRYNKFWLTQKVARLIGMKWSGTGYVP